MRANDNRSDDDYIESLASFPGAFVTLNARDHDDDRVVDFADGYDRLGSDDDDDELEGAVEFIPIEITLPDYVDVSKAILWFDYGASHPKKVKQFEDEFTGETDEYLVPDDGALRIWSKPSTVQRDAEEPESGDNFYLGIGEFAATDLGFTSPGETKTFFIEGVRATTNSA